MPYFVYKVFPAKRYELVETFEKYRDARGFARIMRSELKDRDNFTVRLVHAANPTTAQRLLSERREAPPLGEDA